jgi:GT2 family glycosyltransferase/glycosyltransferase involved in cell wall biosynthesis
LLFIKKDERLATTGGAGRKAGAVKTQDELVSELALEALHRGQEADTPGEARRWLERARRILPRDDTIGLSLASALLRCGESERAVRLFGDIAARWDLLEGWVGLAAAATAAGDPATVVRAMQATLSRHVVSPALHGLVAEVARASSAPGWCAVVLAGWLHADAPAEITHDGKRLSVQWEGNACAIPKTGRLTLTRGGKKLLGSPLDLDAMAASEGFVEATPEGGLSGWAWHPADPHRDPELVFRFADGRSQAMTLTETIELRHHKRPLARPRRFALPAALIPPGPVHVTCGRALWGSPIDPGMERRSAAGLEQSFTPVWASVRGPAVQQRAERRPVDIVVPVYRGLRTVMACLDSVLPTMPPGCRLHVVDDAGGDAELGVALEALAAQGAIVLHRLPNNRGFPGAANTGIAAAAWRDVILLNSDTVVPPGWVERLSEAAYSADDVASACPLSNDATILSYPDKNGGNPMGNAAKLAALARRANGAGVVEIPVAVGFCMYMRRDCLDAIGLLREDIWAQGYGEENDWCLRARNRGWRHVAATGCYVAHEGAGSFGSARQHLLGRNGVVLERLHPGYDRLIAEWVAADPLGPARRRMDALRWRTRRRRSAVVLVTHVRGGGVEHVIRRRASELEAEGRRPVVIRPAPDRSVVVGGGETPNLRYRLPEEWDELLALLRQDRVETVELHHTVDHDPAIQQLPGRLGVPYEVIIHDYAAFCARIALVPQHSYCGEPPIEGCEACVADFGRKIDEEIAPAELVARSSTLLAMAQQVTVPAFDVATRIRRHFPQISPVVRPWEDDHAIPEPPPTRRPIRHVCVIGAIGVEKGYEVLLGCVRDARIRALPLRFTVVGFTEDDQRLHEAGPVFVTERYDEEEAVALVRAQGADIALLPSIWPETWCFTLSVAWRAGLRAAVFDLGAAAERIRRTGWGDVLPLGMSNGTALNNWFLREAIQPAQATRRPPRAHTPSPMPENPAI